MPGPELELLTSKQACAISVRSLQKEGWRARMPAGRTQARPLRNIAAVARSTATTPLKSPAAAELLPSAEAGSSRSERALDARDDKDALIASSME